MKLLGSPLAVWLSMGSWTLPGVGSPGQQPLALGLVGLAILVDQASPLGDRIGSGLMLWDSTVQVGDLLRSGAEAPS